MGQTNLYQPARATFDQKEWVKEVQDKVLVCYHFDYNLPGLSPFYRKLCAKALVTQESLRGCQW